MLLEPSSELNTVIPFLKWAGGKRWLAGRSAALLPEKYGRYIEPFLGSGAVFFFACPQQAILSDVNSRLIETYRAIQFDWKRVHRELRRHHREHSKEYYYREREKVRLTPFTRAAQFIYLNRTCWNGLYRVNLRGEFNVPIGTKTQVVMNGDDFAGVAQRLGNVDLRCCDFSETIASAKRGDLVFADPPYTVKHNMNGFVKYNEKIFTWEDQERLHQALSEASERGVKVTLTNANHASIRRLYSNFPVVESIARHSVLAGSSEFRASTSELLIRNWQ